MIIFDAMSSILLLILIIIVFSIVSTGFWIWMIVDCANNEPSDGNNQIMWIIIIVALHWLGALIYFLARRSQRIAIYGK